MLKIRLRSLCSDVFWMTRSNCDCLCRRCSISGSTEALGEQLQGTLHAYLGMLQLGRNKGVPQNEDNLSKRCNNLRPEGLSYDCPEMLQYAQCKRSVYSSAFGIQSCPK